MSDGGQGNSQPGPSSVLTQLIVPTDALVSVVARASQSSQTQPSIMTDPLDQQAQPPLMPE
jgi:hypothetical protein